MAFSIAPFPAGSQRRPRRQRWPLAFRPFPTMGARIETFPAMRQPWPRHQQWPLAHFMSASERKVGVQPTCGGPVRPWTLDRRSPAALTTFPAGSGTMFLGAVIPATYPCKRGNAGEGTTTLRFRGFSAPDHFPGASGTSEPKRSTGTAAHPGSNARTANGCRDIFEREPAEPESHPDTSVKDWGEDNTAARQPSVRGDDLTPPRVRFPPRSTSFPGLASPVSGAPLAG
jgi:hypothetical protein